jgi:hypothetical protein
VGWEQGFSRRVDSGHPVLLVTDAQGEMVQGLAKDSVAAIVERLEWRDRAVPSDKHRRRMGQGVWHFGSCCPAAAVLRLVEGCSAALDVFKNCSRNFS